MIAAAKRRHGRQRLSEVGREVAAGLKEAIAQSRGEISLPSREYQVPGPVDVKAIRTGAGLSQAEFARRYGFNIRTLQDWESSGAQPPSPVRAYLTVINRFPDVIAEVLKGTE